VGAFGEKLRKQREQRGIALEAISNTTKISTRMLRALEDEHFDQLPGGVFNKGFVRAYARQVGLDEEEAVADYLSALRESQIQANSILPDFRDLHHRDLNNHDPGNDHRPANDLRSNDLRNDGLRHDDAHRNDLPPSALPTRSAGPDRSPQVLRDDRRKQGRRDADRRTQNLQSPDLHSEDHRREDPRQQDLHDEAPRHLDPSPLADSAKQPAAALPSAQRFRQKYPAGNPGAPDSSTQIPWGKLAAGLLVITFALALWNSHRHRESTAASQPVAASDQSPAPFSAPAPIATQPSASTVPPKPAKVSPPETQTLSPGKRSPGTISAAATTSPAASPAITLSGALAQPPLKAAPAAASPASSTTPATNNANPSLTKRTASAAAKPPVTFTLMIRADKTTWVSITADGKPVAHETLIAPAHTSIRATGEIVVKAGNAAGVSFQLNGKDIPAQGNEGEVRTYTFNAAGLRASPVQSPDANR
jgi:cytoskeletal protein RodZ